MDVFMTDHSELYKNNEIGGHAFKREQGGTYGEICRREREGRDTVIIL